MNKLLLVLILVFLYSCKDIVEKEEYLRHVGDIPFDEKLDDPNFKVCNETMATVHYAFENPFLYVGEKPAIEAAFRNINFKKADAGSGYITIRFLVNCEGETGRFRVEQMDLEYRDKSFDPDFVKEIVSTCKSLDGWIPATYKDSSYDYYKYLSFKIEDYKIIDILP